MAHHNNVGKIGEEIAAMFLKKRGFSSFTRNFLRKSGEIDIIAKKSGITHFIEVKTVSRENLDVLDTSPEENVTREKLRKLKNVISVYIEENSIKNWSFDVCAVFLDLKNKKSKVRFLENEILPE